MVLRGQRRHRRIHLADAVDGEHNGGDGKAEPGQIVLEERAGGLRPSHLQRELRQGKGESLVLDPLSPQQRRQAEEAEEDEGDEDQPAGQRVDPQLPRDRLAVVQ
ncbi:hypothetical protein AMK68_04245, partial [candidate division KD3-62 bacterium DG_56]